MKAEDVTLIPDPAIEKFLEAATDARDTEYFEEEKKNRIAEIQDQQRESWKLAKYKWLIATDQINQAVVDLKSWLPSDRVTHSWRHALAILLAERGEVKAAIEHFETIEEKYQLSAGDYRLLSGWYTVEDRRSDFERASIAAFESAQEHELSNYLSQWRNRIQGRTNQTPEELDEDVRFAITSLMKRSDYPSNYSWIIRDLYRETKDFRILEGLAEGMIGGTPKSVFGHLQTWKDLTSEIREEATTDSILKRIDELKKQEQSPTNLRALDLLESIIARRASEVQNQPGPRIERAAQAMRRAFDRQWQQGERVMMASFLENLNSITQPALRIAQLEQLDDLLKAERDGDSSSKTEDALEIAHSRAKTMWNYKDKKSAASDDLLMALNEYLSEKKSDSNADTFEMSNPAWSTLSTSIRYQQHFGRYSAIEKWLISLKDKLLESQQPNIVAKMNSNYNNALAADAEVSIGKGETLYKNLHERLMRQIDDAQTDSEVYQKFIQLNSMFSSACYRKPFSKIAKKDLKAFAFSRLPRILPKATSNSYGNLVRSTFDTLRSRIDHTTAVRFYVERFENMPSHIRVEGILWPSNFASRFFVRSEPIKLDDELEQRLLAIMIEELKYRLTNQNQPYVYLYHHDERSYFWGKHLAQFQQAAEETWQEHRQSTDHAVSIADYLFNGIKKHRAAISLLKQAHEQDLLNESGRWTLVEYLQKQRRFDESISLLDELVQRDPQQIKYHARLMEALFKTGQKERLKAAWKVADGRFAKSKTLDENSLRTLARACFEVQLYEPAKEYFVALVKRRKGNTNDANLSSDNIFLSKTYAKLRNLEPALDAANAAIVVWSGDQGQRDNALKNLSTLVRGVKRGNFDTDLTGLVELCDQRSAKTGQYNYLLRESIGIAFKEAKQYPEAIAQLQLAIELQPGDREIHQQLIECFDLAGDQSGALQQTFDLIKLYPRDVALYQKLGDRLKDDDLADGPGDSERAYTSMVEMLSSETEGHTALAKVRETQKRWDDAAIHWKRVSEIRKKEPAGLLNLCRVYLEQGKLDQARSTLREIRSTPWPGRFNNELNEKLEGFDSKLK